MRTLGIDIGTTTLSILLLEDGEVLHTENVEHHAQMVSRLPFEDIQDPERIYNLVHDKIQKVWASYGRFDAISVTGQMHGIVYVNSNGEPASPLFTWLDLRGDETTGMRETTYRTAFFDETGYDLPSGYGILCHYWHVINDVVPGDAESFTGIIDYVAMKLSGLSRPLMNPSNASSLGCFSLTDLTFDGSALHNYAADMLPSIQPEYHPIGEWRDVPVFCAIGDNQASFAGAVEQIEKSVFVNVGTGSQISCYTPELLEVPFLETRPFPTGGFLLVGAGLSGGKSYAILRDFFMGVLRELGIGDAKSDLYERMNELALSESLEPDPNVITQFFGTRQDGTLRGSIMNISATNFTCSALVRGFIDGTVSELHSFWDKFPAAAKYQMNTLVGAGNGIRRNIALQRAFERSFAMQMVLAPRKEEAAFGAATLAERWLLGGSVSPATKDSNN